jgi:integrase
MARIYLHKVHGFQIKYSVYFPDGSQKTKYRYTSVKTMANELLRCATFIENGSRAGNLNPREVAQARHDKLLSEEEARMLSGGRSVETYNQDKILNNYTVTSAVANTSYGHKCNMGRARFLCKWLSSHPLPSLTSADVRLYAHQRKFGELVNIHGYNKYTKFGVSSKTINNELGILRDLIDEAVELGMVDTNVAREVNVPQKNNTIRRSLNRDEICKLFEAADSHRHLCRGHVFEIIMFALFTGMRRAELRTLCWSDIDLETRKIAVQAKEMQNEENFTTKSGAADTVTIPDKLVPIIDSMARSGRFVFGGDKPVALVAMSAAVKLIMSKAGLPKDLSLHHLRHTFGSWLLKSTGDLSYVQGALRHLDIATTKKYVHTVANEDDPARSFGYD